MKTELLKDQIDKKTAVLGSNKVEPKKSALKQIQDAVKLHLKGVYLF